MGDPLRLASHVAKGRVLQLATVRILPLTLIKATFAAGFPHGGQKFFGIGKVWVRALSNANLEKQVPHLRFGRVQIDGWRLTELGCTSRMRSSAEVAKLALRFVLIVGIVNFFADMTYEGGRGIVGPFLGSLGASATIVGFVAGFGEMVGYGLRSVSGFFADRTHKYWTITFIGYAVNMLAVPALALAGNWPVAAALLVAERTGRAIRKPAVESMLSHAGQAIGHGWVFGLNEALDQTGATLGPLITAWVLYKREGYHHAFGVLLISALLCIAVLFVAGVFIGVRMNWKGNLRRKCGQDFSRRVIGCILPQELHCRWICGFFADSISLPEERDGIAGHDSSVLRGRHGHRRGCRAGTGKILDKVGLPVLSSRLQRPLFSRR